MALRPLQKPTMNYEMFVMLAQKGENGVAAFNNLIEHNTETLHPREDVESLKTIANVSTDQPNTSPFYAHDCDLDITKNGRTKQFFALKNDMLLVIRETEDNNLVKISAVDFKSRKLAVVNLSENGPEIVEKTVPAWQRKQAWNMYQTTRNSAKHYTA